MRKTGFVNKQKYGEDFYQKIGAIGGRAKVKSKGFGSATPEQRKEWGRKGGLNKRVQNEKTDGGVTEEES
jgi:general stress protein YciG